ncbi:phosphonate C-P lyase system protein PhnL [Streptomyces sp. NPDC004752]
MTEVLTVRALTKTFVLHHTGRRIDGLRGIDLTVHRGEHVALAGTNGSGKSTLLKCVYRAYLPTSGSVILHTDRGQVDIAALDPSRVADLRERHIGYVSQFLRSEPRRTVLDLVTKAATRLGLDPSQARDAATATLRELNISERLWHVYPTLLSGGEKQRVNIAAGTIAPPPLLLLDEPISALDPANRDLVLRRIEKLTRQDTAVVSVFHDPDVITRVADRVVTLADGQISHQKKIQHSEIS